MVLNNKNDEICYHTMQGSMPRKESLTAHIDRNENPVDL